MTTPTTPTLTSGHLLSLLSPDNRRALCQVVNVISGKPDKPNNLETLPPEHLLDCVAQALAGGELTEAGAAVVQEIHDKMQHQLRVPARL